MEEAARAKAEGKAEAEAAKEAREAARTDDKQGDPAAAEEPSPAAEAPPPPQPRAGVAKGNAVSKGKALDGEEKAGPKGAASSTRHMDECAHCGTIWTAAQAKFKRCSRCKLVR